jgi:hypothetical protein
VREAVEKFLQSFFKVTFSISITVEAADAQQPAPSPADKSAGSAAPLSSIPPEETPPVVQERDIVNERMTQVFPGSHETG